MSTVPAPRILLSHAEPVQLGGEFVLYWMIAARRLGWNYGLQRAVEHARALQRPLVILEALRVDYPWASDRMHRFVLDGMAEHLARCADAPVTYLPYVEPSPGAGRGLLQALASRAAVVVTDHYPAFFLPRMVAAAATRLGVRLEAVDSNGLMPLAATPGPFPTAYAFRRFLQKNLRPHLDQPPRPDPLAELDLPRWTPPEPLRARWPAPPDALLRGAPEAMAALPIDHAVAPTGLRGGSTPARQTLQRFVAQRLDAYAEDRNAPEREATSGLSPWLHFGHLSIHEVLDAVATREGWTPAGTATTTSGHREGWWGLPPSAEAFLDEAVTWRELGLVYCHHQPGYDRYDTLPDWAQATLAAHSADPRPHRYSREALDAARTHDPLWNAAQTQLVREGTIHNYLRMLWAKKVLEWSDTPQQAWDTLIDLNNRYSLDGRDPNSYTGIAWTFGRFDRPWGPVRPIFGTVRYMSSDNTARKYEVSGYIRRHSAQRALF